MLQYAPWNTTHVQRNLLPSRPLKSRSGRVFSLTHNMRYVSCQAKCSTWNTTPKPKQNTMSNAPSFQTLQLTFKAEVRNPRTFTSTEGSNAGKTYYTADTELSTPGARWSTIRIKVRSKTPIVAGSCNLLMVTMDGAKGEGVADIVAES